MTDDRRHEPGAGADPGADSGSNAAAGAGAVARGEIVEAAAERLKERIYATITMVSVTMSLAADDHMGSADAAAIIMVTVESSAVTW